MRKNLRNLIKHIVRIDRKAHKNVFEYLVVIPYHLFKKIRHVFLSSTNATSNKLYMNARAYSRQLTRGTSEYVSTADLSEMVGELVQQFTERYDVIIGVPRSGLLAGSMVALKLGLPLSTPEQFPEVVWWSKHMKKPESLRRVLLIDDSVATGGSLQAARAQIEAAHPEVEITTATVIVSSASKHLVDYYQTSIDSPRCFEWNLMHSKKGVTAADFDGVLCREVTAEDTRNEETYQTYLETVEPYLIPSFTLDMIISNRLERYRPETEAWLIKHNVAYEQLLMKPNDHKNTEEYGKHSHKILTLLECKPAYFFESKHDEAVAIAEVIKIPIYCSETNSLIRG